MSSTYHVRRIVSAPFAENTFVARFEGRDDCLIVDPGLEPEQIVAYVEREQLTPAMILNTHGHADHIAGNAEMKRLWPECPLVIGRGDAPKLASAALNLSLGFGMPITSPPADRLLDEGDIVSAAGFEFKVAEIPGHSIGHIVFIARGASPPFVFGGDVLFAGSTGRWDFPDGNREQLFHGIRTRLFTLPDETVVYPGHGQRTTTGAEKSTNPVLNGAYD
ncbi:MAG: MBL fold metallo-hydrolase [Planctomycetia bacterium]|nr:MBL fold metallo-hydrolase [Planctomycetia bacterium]